MITLVAAKCNACGDTIYGRSHKDLHWCSCGKVAIRGLQQTQVLGNSENYQMTTVDLPFTYKEIFDDWNLGIDNYGVIFGYARKTETELGELNEINSGSEEGEPFRRHALRRIKVD